MRIIFRKFAQFTLFFLWPILFFFILTTLLFGYMVFFLKIDPSTDALFPKHTPEYKFYREFREHFGSDSLIAVAVQTPDYLTLPNLRLTQALTNLLDSDARVDRVVSVTNAMDIRHKFFGVKVEPLVKGIFEGKKQIKAFKKETLTNPLILGNLVSKDGKTGAILIRLKAKGDNSDFLKGYVSDLRKVLRSFYWPDAQFYVAGGPVEQHDFIDAIRKDQMIFIPTVTLFLVVATFLIYRNLPSVFVAMSVVFVTLIWTFGTISYLGKSMNLVNSLLAPLMMIIAVTNAIHLMNLFSELWPRERNLRESISLTLEHLGVPCFLTAATTMAGFFSLVFNQVPAVQSFGLFASLGTFYSYGITMLLTPVLLPLLPFRQKIVESNNKVFFGRLVDFFLKRVESLKPIFIWASAALIIASLFGIGKIRLNTDMIKDLPEKSSIAIASRFIDENLAGVYSLAVSIRRSDGKSLIAVDTLKKVDELGRFLESQPEVTKVNSPALLVKKVNQARMGRMGALKIPRQEKTLRKYVEKMAESDNPDFWSFVSRDFRQLSLEARMRAVGTEKGRELERRIWRYVKKNWGEDYEIQMTGSVFLLGKMSDHLVNNQMGSLGFAFLVIFLIIALFFRSWMVSLLASVPNLVPILALYGLIGFMGIELSTPTAMISSVAIGLVVDASIHFLYRFRYEFERRKSYLTALRETYRNAGEALTVSTLILVFGFASSVFASFRPTLYFGLLTSLVILFALFCTLVLLPAILVILKPFGPGRKPKPSPKQILTLKKRSSIISA